MRVLMEPVLFKLNHEESSQTEQISNEKAVRDFLVRNAEYLQLEASRIPDEVRSLEMKTNECLNTLQKRYRRLVHHVKLSGHPAKRMIEDAARIIQSVLDWGKAQLLRCVAINIPVLENNFNVIRPIEEFFSSYSLTIADAVRFLDSIGDDVNIIKQDDHDGTVRQLLGIVRPEEGNDPDYEHAYAIEELLKSVKARHSYLLEQKRTSARELKRQCMESIHQEAYKVPTDKRIVGKADGFFGDMEKQALRCSSISKLNEIEHSMVEYEDSVFKKIRESQE